jgi:cytochrome c551/c552
MTSHRLLPFLYACALLAVGAPRLAAQDGASFKVDESLASRGHTVWHNKKCFRCHTFGKTSLVGPDLRGVMHRHDATWLRRWLGETDRMLQTDSTAIALMVAFGGVRMPELKLSPEEVEAVLHYVARESKLPGER